MASDQTQLDQRQPDQQETSDQQQPPVLSFKEFLEKVPPVTASVVQGISHKEQSRSGGDSYYLDLPPTLELHCETAVHCAGVRLFAPLHENFSGLLSPSSWTNLFARYRCCNCSK